MKNRNSGKKGIALGLAMLLAFTFALNYLSLTKFDNIFEKFFGSRPDSVRGETYGADVEYCPQFVTANAVPNSGYTPSYRN